MYIYMSNIYTLEIYIYIQSVCVYICIYMHTHTHTHTGILLSHKKKWNWVICKEMDGTRDCHTESSESEREKQILHMNAYMWNLEKWYAAAAAESRQSCLTPCDLIDGSPPGSPVPGILQARTLEWVAMSFSNAWKWKVKVKSHSLVWLLATLWTVAHQAPPSMGFSRQECWSGVPLPSPRKVV